MRNTNIEEIRDTVKAFLHIPIQETEFSPIIVLHPVFESGIVCYDEKMVNILEDRDSRMAVIKQYENRIDRCEKPSELMSVLRTPYFLTFLNYTQDELSREDFSYLLGEAWIQQENPNQDVNVSVKEAREMFRAADKKLLMDKDEYEHYLSLPEIVTVFRGVAPGRNPDGMSWTTDRKKAEWFASRFGGDGYVRCGKVKKENVLAYFSRRNEEEIVAYIDDVELE